MNTLTPTDELRNTQTQAVAAFKRAMTLPENAPRRDPRYGTRYPGRLTLLHYAFYAIVRGKSPMSVSHDPSNSLKYRNVMEHLANLVAGRTRAPTLESAFNLSAEQITQLLRTHTM